MWTGPLDLFGPFTCDEYLGEPPLQGLRLTLEISTRSADLLRARQRLADLLGAPALQVRADAERLIHAAIEARDSLRQQVAQRPAHRPRNDDLRAFRAALHALFEERQVEPPTAEDLADLQLAAAMTRAQRSQVCRQWRDLDRPRPPRRVQK